MFFLRKPKTPTLLHAFLLWLPLATGLTVMSLLVYSTVHQNYRQSANDPQIQMAEDAAAQIADGVDPADLIPIAEVNLATSLSPFITVFDADNKVVASNAVLDGKAPVPPSGVLEYARQNGHNNITWEPQPNVRIASVSVAVSNHAGEVVMAGRSLREVERRGSNLSVMVLGAWAIALMGSLIASVVVSFLLV